jgi:hypothetical protein
LTAIFLEVSNLLGGLGDAEHDRQRSAPRDWEPFRYSRTRCRVIASPPRRLKDWMERQHPTLVADILVVIGLLVLYKGIHGLQPSSVQLWRRVCAGGEKTARFSHCTHTR